MILLRTTISLFVATVATLSLAAELPSRISSTSSASAAPVFGLYAGVNTGYTATSSNDITVVPSGGAALGGLLLNGLPGVTIDPLGGLLGSSIQRHAFSGGAQIGYAHAFGRAVAGVEADVEGLATQGSTRTLNSAPLLTGALAPRVASVFRPVLSSQSTLTRQIDYVGTARLRLGYAFGPVLVYGTGGLAYGQTRLGYSIAFPGVSSAFAGNFNLGGADAVSRVSVGWTAGGGVEVALSDRWSLKAEGLYFDLGQQSVTVPVSYTTSFRLPVGVALPTGSVRASVRNDGLIVRAGLNYRLCYDPLP